MQSPERRDLQPDVLPITKTVADLPNPIEADDTVAQVEIVKATDPQAAQILTGDRLEAADYSIQGETTLFDLLHCVRDQRSQVRQKAQRVLHRLPAFQTHVQFCLPMRQA